MERHLFDARDIHDTQDNLWNEIFSVAKRIEGLPHGLGMHCGGLVITPEPIYQYAPVEKSAEGYPLIVWEKDGVESRGFVKIDLLGNRSLAVIRDTLTNLKEQGIIIDRNTWHPSEDEETIKALARGDSIGVFYIESPAMRQLQRKTNAGDFEHIVIHSSIIRPAANKFITEYVKRLKGKKWDPLHPRLEKILDETYGILCYQEDVSKVAMALAGFDEADADKLRKVIAKKAGGSKLAVYEKQFIEGCKKNDVADDIIEKVWGMMLSFDGYSFCKPHSASYAMVSFQSAYLRVHYPAHFMASVISNQGGYYRPHAYIAESRRMGLLVEGPDVNLSRWKYYGNGRTVMIGLMAVKGLSHLGGESILDERERGGEYKSLEDFSRRVKLSRDDIVSLCPSGVFDSISNGLTRTMQARRLLSISTGTTKKGENELFLDMEKPSLDAGSSEISISPVKKIQRTNSELWEEYHALGFLRKVHPLALWKNEVLSLKNRLKAIHLSENVGRFVKMIGWPITQKEVWTKDGLTMSFLSLEDESALYETVIFPKIYDKYNRLLFDQQPLIVWGKVCDDMGAISFEIQKIETLVPCRYREKV
jgi:DNA polymerase-3 subunit alpha/error-prone DNA polymerase